MEIKIVHGLVSISATKPFFFFAYIIFFACIWADVMPGLSVSQQYLPSDLFAAWCKEAGPLCVCQPSSLASIVKLNKLVCSGSALTYGLEPKSRDKGGLLKEAGSEVGKDAQHRHDHDDDDDDEGGMTMAP